MVTYVVDTKVLMCTSCAGVIVAYALLTSLTSIVLLNLTLQHLVEHGDTGREERQINAQYMHVHICSIGTCFMLVTLSIKAQRTVKDAEKYSARCNLFI